SLSKKKTKKTGISTVVKVQWKAPSPVRNYPVNAGGGPQYAQQGGLFAPLPPPLDVRRPPPALPVHLMSNTGLPPLTFDDQEGRNRNQGI
ncbi:unnamed protein product, partial [Notodromas monacha]